MNRKAFALGAIVVALAVGIALIGPDDTSPTPSSSKLTTSVSEPPAEDRVFVAPGISFTYPTEWIDRTALADPATWSWRTVAELIDGPSACALDDPPAPSPTPDSTPGCYRGEDGPPPGSIWLSIAERLRPVPGEFPGRAADRTIGSRPAVTEVDGAVGQEGRTDVARHWWWVSGPDGGIYSIWLQYPAADSAIRKPQVDALVASIEFSNWNPPDPADGTNTFEVLGFTATVPTDWHAYSFAFAPPSTAGDDVAMLASTELEPCEPAWDCHQNDPPKGILVDFYNSSCWVGCDWADANTFVGGQPAIHSTAPVRRGMEREYWTVKGRDHFLLISAILQGPDKEALRLALADLIASMELVEPLATP